MLGAVIESAGDAFDAFFQGVVGGTSGSQDSALSQKNTLPPRPLVVKGKSQGTSHSGSKGTPHSKRRKFVLVSSFPDELCKGDLDPVFNKKISHLARCFYYSIENVTPKVAEETDKMSFIGVPRVYPLFFIYSFLLPYTYL